MLGAVAVVVVGVCCTLGWVLVFVRVGFSVLAHRLCFGCRGLCGVCVGISCGDKLWG